MAYLAQNNPQDDQTEQTGQMNQNMPVLASGGAPDPSDVQMTPFSTSQPDPNATKGTGFTNIQKYLNANQTGATNLGNQVAGSINDQTNQAQAAVGKVSDLASSDPTANIWNTQEDTNAQQAITNANQKAALTANVGGQSQLIRDIAPGTSTGGVNLDQFLMQQGQGYGKVSNAAQNAAGLQGDYASKSNQWQNNATTAQALQALQKQAAAGNVTGPATVTTPSTSQVPNTSDIGANTDTGATTANPYLGLSPEQIAYLKDLQAKNAGGGTGTGNVAAPIASTGLINRGTISKTATANTTGGHSGVNISGTDTGGFTDQSDQHYNISANGTVTPADSISSGTAGALGKVATVITGIPGLAYLGAYLANKVAADNQSAADAAQQARQDAVLGGTGEAISVGGDTPGAGDSQGASNVGNVPPTDQQPITADQTAAAVQQGNTLSPAEQVQAAHDAAAQAAATEAAAAQAAATEAANRQAYAQAVAEAQAQQAAAEQAAAQQQAEAQAQQQATEQAAAAQQTTTTQETPSPSPSSSTEKRGGAIVGPGTGTSDSIPIHISNGEYVIKASVVKALGKEFFDRLNNSVK